MFPAPQITDELLEIIRNVLARARRGAGRAEVRLCFQGRSV